MANELSKGTCGIAQVEEHKPLMAKQEQFAQAIASGANQSDAYRAAYSADGLSAKMIWEKASRLASNCKVEARILALKAHLADKKLWTREQSVEALKRALGLAEECQQPAAMTGVVKELNNMHGYASKKLDLNVAAAAQTINLSMTPQEAAEAYAAMLDPKNG